VPLVLRRVRLVCLLSACVVALVACQSDEGPEPQRPASSGGGTILAIEGGKVLELDSRTLGPVAGRSARLGRSTGAAGISPTGSHVAVGGRRAIRVVDLAEMKVVTDLPKPRGYASLVSWPNARRLLVVNEVEGREEVEALILDPTSGRLVVRRRLDARESWPFDVQMADAAAVFLLHPVDSLGPVRLVHFDVGGRLRSVVLEGIVSGKQWEEVEPGTEVIRDVWPALAVDEEGGRAFVVGGGEVVAEVDLQTFRVEYRSLRPSVSMIERLRSWLEPTADAKASAWIRLRALWLGHDVLAVVGIRSVPFVEDGELQERDEPLGLKLVDTDAWSVRVIDEDAGGVERSGNLLLAYARLWDSATQELRGIGLRAYALDGERRFRVLEDRPVAGVQVLGDRALAYLDDGDTGTLVDLRTAAIVRRELTHREMPDRVLRVDGP
jgi:hypothetical protein